MREQFESRIRRACWLAVVAFSLILFTGCATAAPPVPAGASIAAPGLGAPSGVAVSEAPRRGR